MARYRAPLARLSLLAALIGLLALPDTGAAQPPSGVGPCTDEAAQSMPVGEGHDHLDICSRCRTSMPSTSRA